jgi:rhamnogalacturonan endolyase
MRCNESLNAARTECARAGNEVGTMTFPTMALVARIALFCLCMFGMRAEAADQSQNVTLAEDGDSFTLDNGLVTARIIKRSGTMSSLSYEALELLAQGVGGAKGGYWSSVGRATPGPNHSASIRIDPRSNGGERVEVSCKAVNDPQSPRTSLDVEWRYSLGRGERWIYAYAIWSHKPGYPPIYVGEARYCIKLNPDVFDYLTVDAARRRVMPTPYDWEHGAPLNLKEARRMTTGIHTGEAEHKYDYSAVLSETPAYGWSSTKSHVGLWIVNPSVEYIGGGPTKAELTGHLDVNPGALPTLLNMWLGSHYGGTSLTVGESEDWTKVIGPFLIYCNSAPNHEATWKDALARATTESSLWPYAWVVDPNFPPAGQRGSVNGRINFRDPLAPDCAISNLWVGLAAPDYPGRSMFRGGFPTNVDWQRDSKFYQFWARGDSGGRFTIRNVRPGNYTLHAIADGALGELARTNITVAVAEAKQLREIQWTPVRYGRTVWEIGVPDRTAREFRHGDHYWQWGLYFDYPKEFPNDVNFVIGTSDWRRDWNYAQPPRIEDRNVPVVGEEDDETRTQPVRFGGRNVRSTTWSVTWTMPGAPHGKATLRLAFCGTHSGCNVEAFVNDKRIGETGTLPSTSAMQRDGIRAYWIEKDIAFDADLMARGTNVLKLASHANSWSQGVMYDYLRLELDDAASHSASQ